MRRRSARRWLGVVIVAVLIGGCMMRGTGRMGLRPPPGTVGRAMVLEVTGYCACGSCCGWKRTWYGRPVVAYGPQRGQPKAVGITASGSRARPGTIAADTTLFPFGTVMDIPGYGRGVVEDRGSAIQGRHIDLYFRSHQDALEWGRRRLRVTVWTPPATR